MPPQNGTGRIVGLDAARGIAIFGMIATHIYPLLVADGAQISPSWVGASLTGVSSAAFVVLAGVGLSLLTRRSSGRWATRAQVWIRALILIAIGLMLGHIGSNVAIILVHYGIMFFLASWCVALSQRALTITAIVWVAVAPLLHGVLTRFVQLQAGGASVYANDWRLWTSPNFADVVTQPLTLVWDLLFTGYYPVISFFGYILLGMTIGRLNLQRFTTAFTLFWSGTVLYVAARLLGSLALSSGHRAARIAHMAGIDIEELSARAATGSGIHTQALMGAPDWYFLAVPHSGAPLDIYSTAGAAMALIGLMLLVTRYRLYRIVLLPVTATGMIALTAYVVHVLITAMWPRQWTSVLPAGDPLWQEVWVMLFVHWLVVVGIALVVYVLGVRGPLEQFLRQASNKFVAR